MAAILCLVCALLAGLGAWALAGGVVVDKSALVVRAYAVGHLVRRALLTLGTTSLVQELAKYETYARIGRSWEMRSRGWDRPLSPSEASAAALASLLASAFLGCVLARSLWGALLVPLVVLVCAHVRVTTARERDARELAASMPGVLRTMATALESGQTLMQAVEYVGLHERGPAAEPFVRASLRLRCGMSLDEALADLGHELRAPGVDLMVEALSISQRTGSPLRDLLHRSASLVEQQEEFARMLSVRTAQARLSVRIVCLLPPLMVCLLSLISPDFREGVLSPIGTASLLAAAMLDGIALILVRRIMEGVL